MLLLSVFIEIEIEIEIGIEIEVLAFFPLARCARVRRARREIFLFIFLYGLCGEIIFSS